MARASKVDIILDLSPEELMKMSRKDLAKNISIVASAANKRLKRLQLSGEFSPSAEYVRTHGGNFSVKGKTKNQLLIEFFRAQEFMESKTSTVRGAKKWQSKVQGEVQKAILARTDATRGQGANAVKKAVANIFNDPDQKEKFWDLYSRIIAEYDVEEKYKEVWDDIADAMTADGQQSTDDLYKFITQEYESKYQSTAPVENENESYLQTVKKTTTELVKGKVL